MPVYEYCCHSCKKHFECIQRITDEPKATCPECGGKAKRVISQTSFVLKGGGWYKDGYGAGKGSKSSVKSTESSTKTTSTNDKGTTTKKASSKD